MLKNFANAPLEYLTHADYDRLSNAVIEIKRMLASLIVKIKADH
jgi:hypothetical protein